MKRNAVVGVLAAGLLALTLGACAQGGAGGGDAAQVPEAAAVEDVLAGIDASARVVAVSRQAGELWCLAGGALVGVTDDAQALQSDAASVGAVESPQVEDIVALEPDLVVVAADAPSYGEVATAMAEAGVPVLVCDVSSFEDYDALMAKLVQATGRDDLYEQNVTNVRAKIDDVLAHSAQEGRGSYVALCVSADECGALAPNGFVCAMLDELGLTPADDGADAAGEASVQSVAAADPDWVFVVYEGDVSEAQGAFAETFQNDEAWRELRAVKAEHVVVLPQDLFLHAPNARWAEAYAYLSQVLHGAWA